MSDRFSIKDQCDDIYRYVSARAFKLQNMYLSNDSRSRAARQLAILRRATSKEPGSTPDAWSIEFEGLPESLLGIGQQPSSGETAVHIALTLFATHQQSQRSEMHCAGKEFDIGSAVRKYVLLNKSVDSIADGELPRRFAAMSTADSIEEVAHHARQLIQLLKANSIPIDYGRLARQLLAFQIPSMKDGVRLEWGRAYARTAKKEEASENPQMN